MLGATLTRFKSRAPPLGYSRNAFLKKLRNPRASKPWRDRRAMSAGRIDVTLHSDVRGSNVANPGNMQRTNSDSHLVDKSNSSSNNNGSCDNIMLGNLTTLSPLGLRCPHVHPNTSLEYDQPTKIDTGTVRVVPHTAARSSSLTQPNLIAGQTNANAPLGPSEGSPDYSSLSLYRDSSVSQSLCATDAALTTLPMGNTLELDVVNVRTYGDEAANHPSSAHPGADSADQPAMKLTGPVPIHLEHLTRTRREVAESIKVPRHINKLFHKIMGWSSELVELDTEAAAASVPWSENDKMDSTAAGMPHTPKGALRDGSSNNTSSDEALQEPTSQPMLRRRMRGLTDKVKYGVLLASYETDKFALEHRLQLAGSRLERKFLEWEGVHVLDQSPAADLSRVHQDKSSVVLDSPSSSFHIPVLNRDCCSGCGALLQNRSCDEFGYVTEDEVARYVLQHETQQRVRREYATRMAELQAHWSKHGRRVGEEWLDFMTQEEFDAFYRTVPRPFVCQRCHTLDTAYQSDHAGSRDACVRNSSLVKRREQVWSAPDFTHRLTALREQSCVVLLVVDVTDFPGSMVPDLPGLISMNNRVIIAVNKMDCVRNRSFAYRGTCQATAARLLSARHVCRWVRGIAHDTKSFRLPREVVEAVVPVSARRGWNMEELLLAMEKAANWNLQRPGKPLPIYVVGATNVGKSSLINALAHHLYVPQPPHPQSRKIYYTQTYADGKEAVRYRWYTPPNVNQAEMLDIPSRRDKKASKLMTVSTLPGTTVAVNAVRLAAKGAAATHASHSKSSSAPSHWMYLFDTPGILPHWHTQSPLTLPQMRRALIRAYRNPQCFLLTAGHTLFLGGLAAVDVVAGPRTGLLLMVYTSSKVRNAIVRTEHADTFWREQLGRALDPPGSLEQLQDLMAMDHTYSSDSAYTDRSRSDTSRAKSRRGGHGCLASGLAMGTVAEPGLRESRTYYWECFARHRRRPRADIYVCGLGWVSFCVSEAADVVMRVRTLPGVVHGVREPLRYNDLGAFRHWPKLRRRNTARGLHDNEDEIDVESVSTVVHLTETPMPCSASALTAMRAQKRRASDGGHSAGSDEEVAMHCTSRTNHGNDKHDSNSSSTTTCSRSSSTAADPGVREGGGSNIASLGVLLRGTSEEEGTPGRDGACETGRDASTPIAALNGTVATLPRVPKSVHPRHAVSSSEPLESLITELQASGNL